LMLSVIVKETAFHPSGPMSDSDVTHYSDASEEGANEGQEDSEPRTPAEAPTDRGWENENGEYEEYEYDENDEFRGDDDCNVGGDYGYEYYGDDGDYGDYGGDQHHGDDGGADCGDRYDGYRGYPPRPAQPAADPAAAAQPAAVKPAAVKAADGRHRPTQHSGARAAVESAAGKSVEVQNRPKRNPRFGADQATNSSKTSGGAEPAQGTLPEGSSPWMWGPPMDYKTDLEMTPDPDGILFYNAATDSSGHVLRLCHKVKLRSQCTTCVCSVSVCLCTTRTRTHTHTTHTHTHTHTQYIHTDKTPQLTTACSVSDTNAGARKRWTVLALYQKPQEDKVGVFWDSTLKKSFELPLSRIDLSVPYQPIAKAQVASFANKATECVRRVIGQTHPTASAGKRRKGGRQSLNGAGDGTRKAAEKKTRKKEACKKKATKRDASKADKKRNKTRDRNKDTEGLEERALADEESEEAEESGGESDDESEEAESEEAESGEAESEEGDEEGGDKGDDESDGESDADSEEAESEGTESGEAKSEEGGDESDDESNDESEEECEEEEETVSEEPMTKEARRAKRRRRQGPPPQPTPNTRAGPSRTLRGRDAVATRPRSV
jgi:hypothetical protein